MSLFDNLLAPFGTGAQDKAAADQIASIKAGATEGQGYLGNAQNYLQQGGAQGQGFLGQGQNQLSSAYGQGQGFLGQGINNVNSSYAAGLQPLQQTYGMAANGAQNYGNALGVNGAAGNAAARQNFQAGPGYQFLLDQGTQNVDRNRAATGALKSGGTDAAVADYTTGLANQTWQQYISNLQPYLGQQSNAANSIGSLAGQQAGQLAGLAGQQGQLAGQQGNAQAGLSGAQASLAQQIAAAQSGVAGQQASLGYGSNVAQGNAQASADLAPLSAGGNLWKGIGSLAGLAAGAAGGGFGGGGLFGGLGGGGLSQAAMGGGAGGGIYGGGIFNSNGMS